MTRAGLELIGGVIFTKTIAKPIAHQLKIMKCENQDSCVDENLIRVNESCRLFNFFPMLGQALGDFFTPRLECPIQRGDYVFNFTVPINQLALYPMGTGLRKFKVLMIEMVSQSRKEYIVCWSGLLRTLSYSNRKH